MSSREQALRMITASGSSSSSASEPSEVCSGRADGPRLLIAGGCGVVPVAYYGPAINSDTCGVTVDRTAECWGYNGNGQLGGNSEYGIGQYPVNPIPIKVAGQR